MKNIHSTIFLTVFLFINNALYGMKNKHQISIKIRNVSNSSVTIHAPERQNCSGNYYISHYCTTLGQDMKFQFNIQNINGTFPPVLLFFSNAHPLSERQELLFTDDDTITVRGNTEKSIIELFNSLNNVIRTIDLKTSSLSASK